MTDTLKSLTTPNLLEDWHTIPMVETARKYAAELKDQSDLIVLLGHITGGEERELLDSAPEIPVIVSGHVHSGITEAAVPRWPRPGPSQKLWRRTRPPGA